MALFALEMTSLGIKIDPQTFHNICVSYKLKKTKVFYLDFCQSIKNFFSQILEILSNYFRNSVRHLEIADRQMPTIWSI